MNHPAAAAAASRSSKACARRACRAGRGPGGGRPGWRVGEETALGPAGPEREPLSAITARCASALAMLILGPVIAPR